MDTQKNKITASVQENSAKSKNILDMNLFEGFITVYENGAYLWRKFSGITRLTWDDAKLDADRMKVEAEEGILI